MSISDQLKRVIEESGYSSAEVAKMAGVVPRVVQRFVAGERGLTSDSFDKIAEALDLRLTEMARPTRKRARKK